MITKYITDVDHNQKPCCIIQCVLTLISLIFVVKNDCLIIMNYFLYTYDFYNFFNIVIYED